MEILIRGKIYTQAVHHKFHKPQIIQPTMTVPTWLGNNSGSTANTAVKNIAEPTPSVILRRTQNVINIHPELI